MRPLLRSEVCPPVLVNLQRPSRHFGKLHVGHFDKYGGTSSCIPPSTRVPPHEEHVRPHDGLFPLTWPAGTPETRGGRHGRRCCRTAGPEPLAHHPAHAPLHVEVARPRLPLLAVTGDVGPDHVHKIPPQSPMTARTTPFWSRTRPSWRRRSSRTVSFPRNALPWTENLPPNQPPAPHGLVVHLRPRVYSTKTIDITDIFRERSGSPEGFLRRLRRV
jgi:hypothetical protein